jgi:hypothetical protein
VGLAKERKWVKTPSVVILEAILPDLAYDLSWDILLENRVSHIDLSCFKINVQHFIFVQEN